MHGLSTLNRLLGKKNNKEVSRSTSNLSKSHSNLESSSQHNKKIPILNNAPFEQTFRVTVYLPKNQLYVERIGAKTKLGKLMNDVCDSKSLSVDKYEFRHPADMSQVFDNDKSIGEVGLNELRLVLKTESRYNVDFRRYHSQPDDIMSKYKSSMVQESISSSEMSRSNLKNLSKTSPYSSTNSLNSLDSTGMNNKVQPPVAPIRKKKRMAPRPPSENSIPEQEIFSSSTLNVFKEPHSILPRKNFHVSSPQLYNNNSNKNCEIGQKSDSNNNNTELRSIANRLNAITRPSSMHANSTCTEIVKNVPERQRNNSESSEMQHIFGETGSKQNSLERANNKKKPAPVPPTRSKSKPSPSPRTIQDDMNSITEIKEIDEQPEAVIDTKHPKTTSMGDNIHAKNTVEDENANISKVLLNESAPASLEVDGPISIQIVSSEMNNVEQTTKSSVKLPVVSKIHISQDANNNNSEIQSPVVSGSSDDEEMTVNIYNVTTKSVVQGDKPAQSATEKIVIEEQKHVIIESSNNILKEETLTTVKKEVIQETMECRSPSPEWTYKLPPISNSINNNSNNINTAPTDKSVVDNNTKYFSDYTSTMNDNETILSDSNTTILSAETNIQPVINNRRKALDESFRKPIVILADSQSDKSAEVITSDLEDGYLGNKKVTADNDNVVEEISIVNKNIDMTSSCQNSDNWQQKVSTMGSHNNTVRPIQISRSDSFHSISQQKTHSDHEITRRTNALPQRSTSFLSLVHSQKAEMRSSRHDSNVPYSRQKSTSELSISDTPSLQSLEVIKNILNCRKGSLKEEKFGAFDSKSEVRSTIVEESKSLVMIGGNSNNTNGDHDNKLSAAKQNSEKYSQETTRGAVMIKKMESPKSKPVDSNSNENYSNNNNTTTNLQNNKNSSSPTRSSPPQYRYSGPPKINFSTWSERPKVEVSVMSDKDYIFGGATLPHDYRHKHAIDSQNCVDSDVRKSNYTVIVSKENKEAEKHLPKVLGVEYKKDVNPVTLRSTSSDVDAINGSKTIINIKQRPSSVDYTLITAPKPFNLASANNNNSHGQFVAQNRLSSSSNIKFTPIVHGFNKLDNISETHVDVKTLPTSSSNTTNKIRDASEKKAEAPIIPAKPSYLRSTSAVEMNRNVKLSLPTAGNTDGESYDEKPFSQTLRRTGLIEKMLNNDKKTQSIFGKVIDKPKVVNGIDSGCVEGKVEKISIRQQSQQPMSLTTPPPAPPPMMAFRKSAPPSTVFSDMDSRNQLLDAIKNFNKDSLRRK